MPPGIRKNPRHHGTNFNQYSAVRGHKRSLPHLHNRAQTSNKAHDKFVPRRDCACADHSRPSLSTALLSGWSSHLVNRVSPHSPLSQAPLLGQDELTRRKRDLDTRGLSVRLHTFKFPQSQTLACLSANLFPSNFDSKAIWHFSASRFGCCHNPN